MPERPNDYQALYTLAQRIIGRHYFLNSNVLPELLPGRLPDNLPVTIPLPDDCTILGSNISEPQQIGFDMPLSPEAVFDFYFVHFTAHNWKMNNPQQMYGGFYEHGFVNDIGVGVNRVFYREVGPPTIAVQAVAQSSGLTEVWLTISNSPRNPAIEAMLKEHTDVRVLIPALYAPFGAKQHSPSNGGHVNFWGAGAMLESERSLPMIAMHYAAQLEEAGWVRRDAFEHEHYAWHSWTVRNEDKDWGGLFYALMNPLQARERILYLHIGDPEQRRQ